MPLFRPDQNFLKQAPVEREKSPRGFYKAVAIDALEILLAFFAGWTYYLYLQNKTSLIPLIITLSLFALAASLNTVTQTSLKRRIAIIFVASLAPLLFFLTSPFKNLLLALAVIIIGGLWGEWQARTEKRNTINQNYSKIARKKIGKLFSGLILAAILIYLPNLETPKDIIPEKSFNFLFSRATNVVTRIYPEINLSDTVQIFAESFANLKIKQTPEISELPISEQDKARANFITQVTSDLRNLLNVNFSVAEQLDRVIYSGILNKLSSLKITHSNDFKIAWAIIIFSVTKLIALVFAAILALLFYLVIQLLLALNFLFIRGESATKETVTF